MKFPTIVIKKRNKIYIKQKTGCEKITPRLFFLKTYNLSAGLFIVVITQHFRA